MIGLMLVLCSRNLKKLLKFLRLLEIQLFRNKVILKICIFIVFMIISISYYLFIMAWQVLFFIVNMTDKKVFMVDGLKAIIELGLYFIICCLFHPSFFTSSFRLALPSEDIQRLTPLVNIKFKKYLEMKESLTNRIVLKLPNNYDKNSMFVT